jgi:hypothetical protein
MVVLPCLGNMVVSEVAIRRQPRCASAALRILHTYPSQVRPVLVHRRHAGRVSSHFTLRILDMVSTSRLINL